MANFDYTSRDYLSIRQDLLDRAATTIPEWTSRSSGDFGVMLVELWAYYADILHYYVDRAAAETYLETATQTSSVLAFANLFDYKPTFQTASEGTVTLTASNPLHSNVIVVPNNTGFVAPSVNPGEEIFYFTSTNSASLGASVSSITIPVSEGKFVNLESPNQYVTGLSTSDGLSSQRFNLRYNNAIASTVSVYVYEGTVVNGEATAVQYTYVSDISVTSASSKVFTLEITADGVMQVIFGNGVNGSIPTASAEVKVSYRYGRGSAGNISSGKITAFDVGSAITGVSVTSSSATSGGSDAESLASIKSNIPLFLRTQDRAVSKQDFKDLALRVPGVAKASCSIAGTNVLVYGVPYTSNYLTLTTSTLSISSAIQNSVITYFEPRAVVGASVGAASSVTLKPVNITATVHVLPQYVNEWVKAAVINELNNFFTFDNVSFGQTLSIGSIYRALQNIDGVDYVEISVFSFTSSGTSNTLSAAETELLRKGTFTITPTGGVTGSLV